MARPGGRCKAHGHLIFIPPRQALGYDCTIMRKIPLGPVALLAMALPCVGAEQEPAKPVIIEVSDCELAKEPLATKPAREILGSVSGDELEAMAPVGDARWVDERKIRITHPFIQAAHLSFAQHRPLVLDPDMIWQLLVQQAAAEVHKDPEAYRKWFATHEYGKRQLSVRRDEFVSGDPNNDWPGVFAELQGMIIREVPDSPAKLFSNRFTTSSANDVATRRLACLNAASEFYNYHVATMCGIPRIELHGSVEDWEWIRANVDKLDAFHMKRRTQALHPVLDEFVAAAKGKATPAFWKSFYKYSSESGSSYVSGWINLFFVEESAKLLDVVLAPEFSWAEAKSQETNLGALNLPLALRVSSYKAGGTTEIEFVWSYLGETKLMRAQGGFMGIEQIPDSMALKPVSAWRVLRAKLTSEEQEAVRMLSGIEAIDGFNLRELALIHYDPEADRIFIKQEYSHATDDSRFWIKALPLMQNLKFIDASYVLRGLEHPEDEQAMQLIRQGLKEEELEKKMAPIRESISATNRAVCTAMLSAPNVKVVRVNRHFDEKCLEILRSRKDWEVRLPEKY